MRDGEDNAMPTLANLPFDGSLRAIVEELKAAYTSSLRPHTLVASGCIH
jgi:hypothetical protein